MGNCATLPRDVRLVVYDVFTRGKNNNRSRWILIGTFFFFFFVLFRVVTTFFRRTVNENIGKITIESRHWEKNYKKKKKINVYLIHPLPIRNPVIRYPLHLSCDVLPGHDCVVVDRCSGEHTPHSSFGVDEKDLSMIVNTISTLRSKHIQHICHLPRMCIRICVCVYTIFFFPSRFSFF